DENGSTVMKSTVPAIVVLSPSIGNRLTVRMPDSPAVSRFQLSALPAPSEVMTPIPVTTTTGRSNLSRAAVMVSPSAPRTASVDRLDQGHAFTLPMAGAYHDNLGRRGGHFNLESGRIVWRKQFSARDRKGRERKTQRKLGFDRLAERGVGCAHRIIGMLAEEGLFFRCHGLGAGRAGDQRALAAADPEL